MKLNLIILTFVFLAPLVSAECICTCDNESILQNKTENYVSFNTTINLTQINDSPLNSTNLSYILPEGYCNISLNLSTDKIEYPNGEKISIYNKLSSQKYSYTIDYWIEDLEGNLVKEHVFTTNTNTKQYTPELLQDTQLIIKNNLTKIDCKNIINNTYNKLQILVNVEENNISSMILDKLYINRSKKISFGDNLTTSLSIYTGNNSEYPINFEIENLTSTQSYIVHGKYNNTKVNITIQIPVICNLSTSAYTLSIESKDFLLKENITIVNNCKNTTTDFIILENISSNGSNANSSSSENIINPLGSPITGKVIYESSSIKAKNIVIYAIIIVLALAALTILLTNKNINKLIKEKTEKWSSQLEQS